MLSVPLRVTVAGTTHEVDAGPLELVMFEREYGVAASALASEPRIEWLCWLAYRALRNRHLFDGDFDTFLLQVESVEGREATAVDPTDSGPPTG